MYNIHMNEKDDFTYDNEEEAEMAQLHSIHLHMNAIAEVRKKIGKGPSLTHCEECGEEIPEARRIAVSGCKTCITCQENLDKRKKLYGA